MFRTRLLALATGALALCAACGSDSEAAETTRIAVIPKGTTHEFWKTVHAGALTAARELGVEIIWKGPLREDDRDAQIKVVEDFVIRGVDGIVLMPLDNRALVPAAKEAAARGIPVIIADSDLDWDGRASFVATDNFAGGRLAAKSLGERLDGTGRVVMMRYLEGSASTMKREEGFLAELAESFPEIEVLSSNQHAGATTEGAYQTAENLLQSFPQVEGVFCSNESASFGMLRALQDAGRAGQVRFVGFDASDKLLGALENSQIDALIVQDPFAMGELSVRRMVEHLAGKPIDERIDTGVGVATRESMSDPKISRMITPDLSILAD